MLDAFSCALFLDFLCLIPYSLFPQFSPIRVINSTAGIFIGESFKPYLLLLKRLSGVLKLKLTDG
jgi:hypothetical protein